MNSGLRHLRGWAGFVCPSSFWGVPGTPNTATKRRLNQLLDHWEIGQSESPTSLQPEANVKLGNFKVGPKKTHRNSFVKGGLTFLSLDNPELDNREIDSAKREPGVATRRGASFGNHSKLLLTS